MSDEDTPKLPPADADGHFPAVATLDALIAHDLVRKRLAAGLTRAELARKAGVQPEAVRRIEQGAGRAGTATLKKLLAVLGNGD